MGGRGARILGFLAALFAVLFAGRWTAAFLADRWWAAELSPAAVSFLGQWHVLRLVLDLAAVLVASAWFVGHLLVVYRAIGSVQVPRRLGNLEIREAMTPRTLLALAVLGGIAAGLAAGLGASAWWDTVALAWKGVTYGETDPLLRRDLGLYVAQLPLWRTLHGFALLLVLLALAGVFLLYLIIGSVRWVDGRPAVSDHARSHLGWLLTALALALGWGYLLEPYELVAGVDGTPVDGSFGLRVVVAQTLAGTALMVALLSAVWAWRPRHALVLAGWAVLVLTSLVGHHVLPGFVGTNAPLVDAAGVRHLEQIAFGLDSLREVSFTPDPRVPEPYVPSSLWHGEVAARVGGLAPDSLTYVAPAVIRVAGRARPSWLVLRSAGGQGAHFAAVADDTAGPTGLALLYRAGDTLPSPGVGSLATLPVHAVRPGAPEFVLTTRAPGVPAAAWHRRLVLAWARQAGPLLGEVPPGVRLAWHLSPTARLERLAPFVRWGRPSARIVGGRLLWLADGYVTARHFPLVGRTPWNGAEAAAVRAGFLGVITAETGETRVYLREDADPISRSWAELAAGVVEPAATLPYNVLRAAQYPAELFRVQARVLERRHYDVGRAVGRPDSLRPDATRTAFLWARDTAGAVLVAPYAGEDGRRVSALLTARRVDGRDELRLVRVDSARSLPTPAVLEGGWGRFPSFERIRDSVVAAGGSWRPGPIRYWLGRQGLAAYQPSFALSADGDPVLAWVSVAEGDRRGAGRSLLEGWRNLEGAVAPPIAGVEEPVQLEEARRWFRAADSALRSGDWTGFGRAYEALRRVLEAGAAPSP